MEFLVGSAQLLVCLGIVGFDVCGFLEIGKALLEFRIAKEKGTELELGLGVFVAGLRGPLDGLLIGGDGVGLPA
jgi:hypothetical protein